MGVTAVPETRIRAAAGGRAPAPVAPGHAKLNVVEAMDAVRNRPGILGVRTERSGSGAVALAVQDAGPGIDPKQVERIFEAFVTTKSQGMGLGLAIALEPPSTNADA